MAKPDSPEFLAFWNLWKPYQRSSDGRGKARPAYQQMIEQGADPQDIIDGAAWYLRNLKPEERPYIPLASSWLRSERWADECIKERQHGPDRNVVEMRRSA